MPPVLAGGLFLHGATLRRFVAGGLLVHSLIYVVLAVAGAATGFYLIMA